MPVKPLVNEHELLEQPPGADQRAFTELFNYYQRDVYLFSICLQVAPPKDVSNAITIIIVSPSAVFAIMPGKPYSHNLF